MTTLEKALEQIRDHSVGTTEDGPCIECEHMVDIAKAAIPVAELEGAEITKDIGGTARKIFSGDYSRDMWDEIKHAKSKQDLRWALYLVCCRIQELEGKVDKIAEKQRREK